MSRPARNWEDGVESEQVWRMLRAKRWVQTVIVVGVWSGCAGYLMLQGEFELTMAGLVAIAIGLAWAWIQFWLPKAVITSTHLRVVNRVRRVSIDLNDIRGTVEGTPSVTFALDDGRRIPVVAMPGMHVGRKLNPALGRHSGAFVQAVFAAKERRRLPA